MVQGKILKHLGERIFEIEIPEDIKINDNIPYHKGLTIQHDFIQFEGATTYYMEADKNGKYPIESKGASNHLHTRASLQIGIRDFKEFYLPLILNHEYFQDEHLEDRVNNNGDYYPSYAYNAVIIKYYDKVNKVSMVAFRKQNEKVYSRLSLELFEEIKNTLNLYKK